MRTLMNKLKAKFNGEELPKPRKVVLHDTFKQNNILDFGKYFEESNMKDRPGTSTEQAVKATFDFGTTQAPYSTGDTRYNEPKEEPLSSFEEADEAIDSNDIYSDAKDRILNAQRKQVAYGLDKYPEPLNADTWTISETINHIMDECVDQMHYLSMLQIKLEEALDAEPTSDYPMDAEPTSDDTMDAFRYAAPLMSKAGVDLDSVEYSNKPKATIEVKDMSMVSAIANHTISIDIQIEPWASFDQLLDAVNAELKRLHERGAL